MPQLALTDLPPGPLLGLDPGAKTIGVAVSSSDRAIVTPVETIRRGKFTADAARIFTLYDEFTCCGLVIGLPVNMDGSAGPRVQSARALGTNLLRLRDIPLAYQDERLSTHEAEERLIALGIKRDDRKAVIDAHAAAVILQSAINAIAAPKA
ncbi:Holliday junction resolvase RuvX [Hyphobacterium marinum]|uniref:Putative pre-16S rRNA nuclease n=1 Tax=Hyphobacterium marinum TaxID=3116574 RepID=A0ABU7LZ26_9PROT|nr:Holliday junction resolvase RuvX [Hyphobacterium sp. Y6023]MEE2566811.1 Holliday junction resolvase RuvX [Hyphobacterium sp. Y6023]